MDNTTDLTNAMTESQARELVRAFVAENRLTPSSHLLDFSAGALADVCHARRPISKGLAAKFGLRRVSVFIPVHPQPDAPEGGEG